MTQPRRRRREFARRVTRESIQAARQQGCACQPDAIVEWEPGGIPLVRLAHDDWCPLMRVMNERTPDGRWQVVIDTQPVRGEQN